VCVAKRPFRAYHSVANLCGCAVDTASYFDDWILLSDSLGLLPTPLGRTVRRISFDRPSSTRSFIVHRESAALGVLAHYTRGDTSCSPQRPCDSVLRCVHCSVYRLAERKADLGEALRAAPGVAFVTFTKGRVSDALADEWDVLDAVRARFTERGTWSRFKKRHAITGYAFATEVTHSSAGWHVHLHGVMTLGEKPAPKAFSALKAALVARWVAAAARSGAIASERHQDVKEVPNVDRDEIAGYLTKQNLLRSGSEGGSVPPGCFLKRSQEDSSDLDAFVLWHEYTTGARGRTFIAQFGSARAARASQKHS